ncbi:MAG: ribosome silencing factor RsfS [Bdellovibrio sp.]|nr:MAG: ribosome silencing factor RsfS [Bdellovibrio sp.]
MDVKKRVGIYGGSFNPPHVGHVNAVELVKRRTGLQEILVIPNWQNPLKKMVEGPSPGERLEMTRLAFQDLAPEVMVDDVEVRAEKTSFTINTVEALKKRERDAEFFLILGQDLFEQFNQWEQWERLVSEVNLIITSRPGFAFPKSVEELPRFMQPLVSTVAFNHVELTTGHEIQFVQLRDVEISSTELRKWLRIGRKVDSFLDLSVEKFIREHRLYTSLKEKIRDYREFTDFCARVLFSRKAIQVKGFDLRQITAPSEFSLVCSGTSTRHTSALAENVVQAVKEEYNLLPLSLEGASEGRWVLLDYGSLIIHVFYDYVRQDYSIEELWKEAKDLQLQDPTPAPPLPSPSPSASAATPTATPTATRTTTPKP